MATNGLVVMTPTSIAYSGTSASINSDGSVAFSAVTSLSLNGVFTGDYDNYMVTIRHSVSTSGQRLRFRFRASGTDNSTASSYTNQEIFAYGTSITAQRVTGDIGQFSYSETSANGVTSYVFGPYLSQPTAHRTVSVDAYDGAELFDIATTHNQSVSYDGYTLIPNAYNITGLVTVFGFAQ